MEEAVSAADARRELFLILRRVRQGQSYIVTSQGQTVARIVPANRYADIVPGARQRLLTRLEAQPLTFIGRWCRDKFYNDNC